MKLKAGLVFLISVCSSCAVFAQQTYPPKTSQVQVQVGTYLSTSNYMPFWFRANQFGTVPLKTPVATVRVGAWSDYARPLRDSGQSRPKKVDWGYGVEAVVNAGNVNQVIFPEAYVKGRFHFIELYAGRRRTVQGLVDTTLTSGSYAWSGNAVPIPVVQLGTPGFVSIPFTNDLVAVNAFYNHGWFGNDRIVKGSYLHQKALYGRLGRPQGRLKLYAGINHQVQWAGYSNAIAGDLTQNGRLPSSLKSYWFMVTARRNPTRYDSTLASFEENRVGNHLGSFDLALEAKLGSFNLLMYRQSVYDDGSLFYLTNIRDGLQGLRLRNERSEKAFFAIDEALFEFLYTKSQGGSDFVISNAAKRGLDNYFNHSQYIDGWVYESRTIGTPFLTPGTEVRRRLPKGAIANNRVRLFHFALSGSLGKINWLGKLSYSDNDGTYDNPFPANTYQLSTYFGLTAPVRLSPLGDFQLNAAFASDYGRLFYHSAGVFLGLKKTIASQPH
ncbi:capsule assembly Wzi family protein [Larkinella soli]|uniref:capsule assembly Wzi family protein n=1 Tax=Larkinella soli TaxID=1770527 RepID=UPI000FFB2119|nr:capsule assembly Wzi family protein [Larkinella soli]